jgi:metallophosphoesterase (TIGR03767 family)
LPLSERSSSLLTLTRRIGPGKVLARGTDGSYRSLALTEGEAHLVRTDLLGRDDWSGPTSGRRPLLCFAHLTDLQLADVQSPVRFEFFNREFTDPRFAELIPVQRPQESLTPHAVGAMIRALNEVRVGPATDAPIELVVTTGDSIDNAQWNELAAALDLLEGGRVRLDSGAAGYEGVQASWWPDRIFWQPDGSGGSPDVFRSAFGFPTHPGLLDAANGPFRSDGLRLPWLACHGNHEALIQGVGRVTTEIATAIVGGLKPTRMSDGVSPGRAVEIFTDAVHTFMSGHPVRVSPDPGRRTVTRQEFVAAHFRAGANPSGHGFTEANRRFGTAYYVHDVGPVRFIAMDTACIGGGAGGWLDPEQAAWLTGELEEVHSTYRAADGSTVRTSNPDRLVVLLSHHGLETLTNRRGGGADGSRSLGAAGLRPLLHRFGNVVLWMNGHTHANAVTPPGRPP